jgi:hypothetical protein
MSERGIATYDPVVPEDDEPRRVYRSRFAHALFLPSVVVVVALGAVVAAASDSNADVRRGLVLYAPLAAVWCFLLHRMNRSRIEVRPEAVTIRNNFGPVLEVPWRDIDGFDEGGYWGIDLVLRTGGRLTMNAVQKSSFARLTNKRTGADDVVDQLNGYLEEFTGSPV